MVRAIRLAVWDEQALLTLHEEASTESPEAGALPQGTQVALLDRQGIMAAEEDLAGGGALTEAWFRVQGDDPEGNRVEGWAPASRIRVRGTNEQGAPVDGTVRPKLGAAADPLTSLYAEPNEGSQVVGKLARGRGAGQELASLSLVLVEGQVEENSHRLGAIASRCSSAGGTTGRISERYRPVSLPYIEHGQRPFLPSALVTTLLVMVLIIRCSFVSPCLWPGDQHG
jgi:hypothetical protein